MSDILFFTRRKDEVRCKQNKQSWRLPGATVKSYFSFFYEDSIKNQEVLFHGV